MHEASEGKCQKLTDDAIDMQDRNDILKKNFWQDGITNADDTISFEAKCDEFENYCSAISDPFLQYFNRRLRKHLKSKVNEPVRDTLISENWTNNNCESINHVLKQTVDWKSKPLTEFVELVEEIVVGQFKDLRGGLIGTGEFRLAESHKQFQTTKTDWITMTEQQKMNLFRRYRKFIAKDSDLVVSTDGQSTVVAPKTNGRKPGLQRNRKINIRTTTIAKKTKNSQLDWVWLCIWKRMSVFFCNFNRGKAILRRESLCRVTSAEVAKYCFGLSWGGGKKRA